MLSMHSDEAYVTRAPQAGATGYMLKDSVAHSQREIQTSATVPGTVRTHVLFGCVWVGDALLTTQPSAFANITITGSSLPRMVDHETQKCLAVVK